MEDSGGRRGHVSFSDPLYCHVWCTCLVFREGSCAALENILCSNLIGWEFYRLRNVNVTGKGRSGRERGCYGALIANRSMRCV